MKTEHQLRQILAKREIPTEIADSVIERFTEAQLIDDAAYAKAFVAGRLARGGKSRAVIRRELKQKGVSDDLANQALEGLDRETEAELALGLARKRLNTLSNYDREVKYRRLQGFLARRGFDSEIIRRTLSEVMASG
jgi:regulatory protein